MQRRSRSLHGHDSDVARFREVTFLGGGGRRKLMSLPFWRTTAPHARTNTQKPITNKSSIELIHFSNYAPSATRSPTCAPHRPFSSVLKTTPRLRHRSARARVVSHMTSLARNPFRSTHCASAPPSCSTEAGKVRAAPVFRAPVEYTCVSTVARPSPSEERIYVPHKAK